MKYAADIDLTENRLKHANLEMRSSDPEPSESIEGQIYYNSTEKMLKFYNGEQWVVVATKTK